MKQFPAGSRHIFENTHRLELVFCEKDSPAQEHYRSVIEAFSQKKSVLWRALWEVDSLLDTDQNWLLFAIDLVRSAKLYRSIDVGRLESERRKKASILRREAGETAINLIKKIRELRELAMDSQGEYSLVYTYDDPSGHSVFSLMGMAADCHNEFKEYFDDEPCTYRENLEIDILELVYKTSSEARPDSLAFLMAFASLFIEEKIEHRHHDGHFDPLTFSKGRGKADFIRAFTNSLKNGINRADYPERLQDLSFLSIDIFAGVLFPYTTTKVRQCIDADWNPIKDSADKTNKAN